MDDMNKKDNTKVKSLKKAMNVLEVFSIKNPELTVTQISQKLSLHKSNVHNILSTFNVLGYIDQDPETLKYRLGYKVLYLSYILNAHMSIQRIALPYMQKIADSTNENVYLAIPSEDEIIYLESCSPYGIVPLRSLQGERAPMYCTGIGKAMLAFSSHTLKQKVLLKEKRKYTENTIVDKTKLSNELDNIYKNGYAIDNMEHEFGIKCVAVPLLNNNNEPFAAVSVSGPSLRINDNIISKTVLQLNKYKQEIENIYKY